MAYSALNTSTFAISIVTSDTVGKAPTNTIATNIYVAGVQLEDETFATSYIPTTSIVTRAADALEEVATPLPSMSNALGSSVTTSHIGLEATGTETASMSRLEVHASPGTNLHWGAELIFTT